ncbi:MAG: glycosyltransferase family 39 protein [Gemmatimonadales bacterium]|nr:glycosyltransferase family 39 protein [Gemmatimonadales bacterium]
MIRWLALCGLSLAATMTLMTNGFVQDDLPIVAENTAIHTLGTLPQVFGQPYWPPPYPPDLYRPAALTFFGLQWAVGGGSPVAFRIVSMILLVLTVTAVWRLGTRLCGGLGGWVAAALFAVHPVHVEANALAVNQGELVVTLITVVATLLYLRAIDQTDGRLSTQTTFALLVLYGIGMLFKETGTMLPAVLVLAAVLPMEKGISVRERLTRLRPTLLGLVLVASLVGLARDRALGGNLKGSFTAEALAEQTMVGRAHTMLGVYPAVARLLVWPHHLQADYSPQEFVSAETIGPDQLLGLGLLAGGLLIAVIGIRRQPALTFALGWIAIGYFPVSNILVPAGITLAERTLFLPSVGAALLGGMVAANWPRTRLAIIMGAVLLAGLLLAGVSRSSSRNRVWSDERTLVTQTLIDAPLAYRTHRGMAILFFSIKEQELGERLYRRALELHPQLEVAGWELADQYRLAGMCEPAVPLYRRALERIPEQAAPRGSLIACLAWLGRYDEARIEAVVGLGIGIRRELFARWRLEVLAAQERQAPAQTVRLVTPPADPSERRRSW